MRAKLSPAWLWRRWAALFEEEAPEQPRYDPVHLATVLVGCLVALGALYWLLWGALVFEGGLDSKLRALAAGRRSGPELEGWLGNALSTAGLALAAAALWRAGAAARPRR